MITPSMSQNGIIYVDKQITECSSSPERWCVRYANRQEAWDFIEDNASLDFIPKNIQVRKMVLPTDNPWKFEIALYIRWKSSQQQVSSDQKICSVVVFDKSGSMWVLSWWSASGSVILSWWGGSHEWDDSGNWKVDDLTWWIIGAREYIKKEKWNSAVSWAIDFSNYMFNQYDNSSLGLVFFWTTATVAQELAHSTFSKSIFDDVSLEWSTNIHDWLIKAGEMLSWADCDKKYIILMTDWVANKKMTLNDDWERELFTSLENEGRTPTEAAIWYALDLKDAPNLIEIFTIWYWLENLTNSGEAINTLMSIASNPVETHYFNASEDNITEIFNDIWENQIIVNNMKITSIADSLWNKILWNEINITEETSITESWVVYSFPIRIDPTASWWVKTNDGLTLNYIDANWVAASLTIPASKSSEIYWTQPKCDWILPEWVWIILWSWEYMQSWVKPTPPQRGQNDEYELYPSYYPRHYTWTSNPWVCEWSCTPWYQLNQQGDWCEEIVVTHEVNINVDPAWYGSVDNSKVIADHLSSIVIDNSKRTVRVGYVTVTATPNSWDAQYTYEFSGWNNTCGNEVTDNCSITAEFRRSVNKYLITWKNWDGTVLDSWMVEYGTTPVYNWVNPPIRPADASNTYTFNGWNPTVTWVTNAQDYTAVYIPSANSHTVSFSIDPVWYWSVDKNKIVANSWAEIEWIWDTITIWGETVRATPISWDEQYTYEFSWWNLDDCGDILTSSCTIVAEFRSVKNIKLNIVSNNSEYWNVDVSSGYFYPGTLSLFTSGNELRVLKATIWPTKTLLTSIASPNADDEHYNYRFVDWSIPDSCSGQYNFNDDCTVVANFERLANKYLITFVNYDWTVLQQSEMEYGSKPKYMWGTPEKLVEWYTNTFVWWDPEINSTTIVEWAQVYTATFTSVANNYTVLFSWNGAIWEMPWQSFIYWVSQKLSKNSFVMDWYKFIWWNTESNWNWAWYADEESVKNLAMSWEVTLYAQWWANTYIVVFNWNNNTSWSTNNQDMELWESENLNENNFVRDWYTFSWRNTQEDWNWKWYSDEELVNNLASSAWEIVTLYAQWTPNPYTIVFNGNWASTWVMGSQSMVYDVESILNENMFVRDWYIFNWWNTKADWTWKPYSDKSLVKNLATEGTIVLYAQWKTKNSWWSSGWWTKNKDDCPNGDYSWDYYDKKCWSKVKTWKTEVEPEEKPTTVTPVENKTETKKCSIEWSKYSAEVNEAYIWACKNWIIKSQTIQGARLWEFLNRAEMAKIVSIFEMLVLDSKPNRNKDCSAFADSISWYNAEMKNYMITSCQLERMWIHTADHKPIKDFMPKKFVSRAEFWTILSRILRWNKYEAPKNSSKYYVKHLKSLKWEEILSNTNPELKERRSYAILMIYRAAKKLGKA